jgi:uncharacterized protein (TIRG00374 family)
MDSLAPNPPVEEKKTHVWLTILIFASAAGLLFYSLRGLDWSSFWEALRHGRYFYLFLTLPIGGFNYFLRALRWRVLVENEKGLSPFSVFWANMIGYLGNLYLPARAGELFRSAILGKETGSGTSFILATALTERIIDAMTLVVIFAGGLLWQNDLSPLSLKAIWAVGMGGAVGLLLVIILPHQEKRLTSLICQIPLSITFRDSIQVQSTRFLNGMRSLQRRDRIIKFLAFTVLIWWIDGWSIVIGARILSQTLSLSQALILLAALGLSSAIPSTPGYIGVYQFVAVSVLIPFGFSRAESLAYIIIIQISGYLLVSLLGLIGLWQAGQGGGLPSTFQMNKRT